MALKVIKGLNKLGLLRKQSPLPTPQLTQALLKAFQTASKGETAYEAADILLCWQNKQIGYKAKQRRYTHSKKITLQNKSASAASSE